MSGHNSGEAHQQEESERSNQSIETGAGYADSLSWWLDYVLTSILNSTPFEVVDIYFDIPLYDLFDEFQWKLFKILLIIVFTNLALIAFFWHIYGKKIVEKFMQPTSSARLIEELKNSISDLKLPKEHSPRI